MGVEGTPEPQTSISPPRRLAFIVLQLSAAVSLVTLSFVTGSFEKVFAEMEMRELPLPTEGILALSRFLRWPPGLALFVILVALIVYGARRGALDLILKKLIWANVIALLVMIPLWVLSIFLPIIKIQQQLEK